MKVDIEWDELYPYPRIYKESDPHADWRFTDAWNCENLEEISEELYQRWVAMDKEREAVIELLRAETPK